MPGKKAKVLIVNIEPWFGLARLPKLLVEAGCQIFLYAPSINLTAKTKHIHELIPASQNIDDFISKLQAFLTEREFDWIIPGDDTVLQALFHRHSETWAQKC